MKKVVLMAGLLVGLWAGLSAQAASPLPAGYTPLLYIESTGLEQIDTGVNAGAHTTVDMRFGHVKPIDHAVIFGKDIWNPKGFLFIVQFKHIRFFGNVGNEPGPEWNLADADPTETLDYHFVLGADSVARLTVGNEEKARELKVDRTSDSSQTLKLFKGTHAFHGKGGVFRLYSLKLGTDAGEAVRDFVPCRTPSGEVGLWDRVTGRFFGNVSGFGAFFGSTKGERWTLARAQAWGKANPWLCGFNHVPANAINDVEIWQKSTFSPELIRKEFALAKGLGLNCVRIFLQYKVYEDDPAWLLSAFEQYLKLADEVKLKVMPVLFDDCAPGVSTDPILGKQPDPLPGWTMWGWVPSPSHEMVVDWRTHGKLEKYLKDVIGAHKDDPRIFVWDLYNEPAAGGAARVPASWTLVKKCFAWAREIDPVQPLTVCVWVGTRELNDILLRESDVVSFHSYRNPAASRAFIKELAVHQRPLICTEWMCRTHNNTIRNCLGIYKETGVGCMMWGLVNGKTQTYLPFGHKPDRGVYKGVWKHDIYHTDHTPYDAGELELLKKATKGIGW